MKKNVLALILIIFAFFNVYGQNADPIDLILVLNTSSGMASSYENVNNYITGPFLSEFMRVGDTFHMVAFAESSRLDVARRVASLGDVETIVGRMLLQYPVESGDNLSSAISYAENYLSSLPNRPKKIVVVSTGGNETGNLISSARQRLGSKNATIDFIQVIPGQALSNLPKSGRSGGSSGQSSQIADSGYSQTDTGPSDITSSSGTQSGTQTPVTWHEETPTESRAFPWFIIAGIILLLLLILGLILFLTRRGAGGNRYASSGGDDRSGFADHSEELAKYAASQNRQRTSPYSDRPSGKPIIINPTGPLILNLFVEEQSTAIGKRNIHSLKSDYSLTVGGGGSDFLIFLVPVPARIGELRRNGSQLTFIPRKPKYFPDLGSHELRDCLNKTIRIISDRGYEMRFRFEMYEDPLVALNRIMNSIKVPG